jgi:hypothetical protein
LDLPDHRRWHLHRLRRVDCSVSAMYRLGEKDQALEIRIVNRGGVHSYGRVSLSWWLMVWTFERLAKRRHLRRFRFQPLAAVAEGSPRTAYFSIRGCHAEDVVLDRGDEVERDDA